MFISIYIYKKEFHSLLRDPYVAIHVINSDAVDTCPMRSKHGVSFNRQCVGLCSLIGVIGLRRLDIYQARLHEVASNPNTSDSNKTQSTLLFAERWLLCFFPWPETVWFTTSSLIPLSRSLTMCLQSILRSQRRCGFCINICEFSPFQLIFSSYLS